MSEVGRIGGGQVPRPGEGSLAQNGGLFLDELPEFRRHVLDLLRGVGPQASHPLKQTAHGLTTPYAGSD